MKIEMKDDQEETTKNIRIDFGGSGLSWLGFWGFLAVWVFMENQ